MSLDDAALQQLIVALEPDGPVGAGESASGWRRQ